MLYRTHLGKDEDKFSLRRWMKLVSRNRQKLWDGGRELVKDFRSCLELFEIILDAHVLGAIASFCGINDTKDLAVRLSEADINLQIGALADYLIKFNIVHNNRRRSSGRDKVHENLILFLQHALVLRNFTHAIKYGDPGRALTSISYMTVWFQASKQTNYASETLHLVACMRKIWSTRLQKFYKDHCLVNLSGKKGGFIADDNANEHVVREVKDFLTNHKGSADENKHVCDVLSPQSGVFMDARQKTSEQYDINFFDTHHSVVDTVRDIVCILDVLFKEKVFVEDFGRDDTQNETEVASLFTRGLEVLSTTQRIADYKKKVKGRRFRDISDVSIISTDLLDGDSIISDILAPPPPEEEWFDAIFHQEAETESI
jgi:hypothetical protein